MAASAAGMLTDLTSCSGEGADVTSIWLPENASSCVVAYIYTAVRGVVLFFFSGRVLRLAIRSVVQGLRLRAIQLRTSHKPERVPSRIVAGHVTPLFPAFFRRLELQLL